jgi:DNA-directed RNA polymerase subunit beta
LAVATVPRTRRTFARLNKPLDVPNLIDIQRRSFEWLTDPVGGGLRETIDDISPIEDYTGNLAVQFGEFVFDEPVAPIEECREKDLTFARPPSRWPSSTGRPARSASSRSSSATSRG